MFRTHLPCHIWQSHLAKQILAILYLLAMAANRAATAKRKKYTTVTQTHDFLAIALESSGAWSS